MSQITRLQTIMDAIQDRVVPPAELERVATDICTHWKSDVLEYFGVATLEDLSNNQLAGAAIKLLKRQFLRPILGTVSEQRAKSDAQAAIDAAKKEGEDLIDEEVLP